MSKLFVRTGIDFATCQQALAHAGKRRGARHVSRRTC